MVDLIKSSPPSSTTIPTNAYTTESGTGGTKLSAIASGTYAAADKLIAVKGGTTDQQYTISNIFSNPPSVGDSTPGTGAFTNLSANSGKFNVPGIVGSGVSLVDASATMLLFANDAGGQASVSMISDGGAQQAGFNMQASGLGGNVTFYGGTAGDYIFQTSAGFASNMRFQTQQIDALVFDQNQVGTFYQYYNLAEVAAPSSPSAGFIANYADSTNHVFSSKSSAGTVSNTVVPKTAASHKWFSALSAAGVLTDTQPAFSDISGSVAASQLPNPSASTLGGIESLASASHKWINTISTSGVPSATQPDFTDLSGTATFSQLPANDPITAIEYVIDGGGATITTGLKGYLEVPFGCTINRATTLGDRSSSCVVDIFKCTYSNFDASSTHPVSGDKITASAPPTISSATKAQDSTLTGWTTSITAGDILAFNVNSNTAMQRITVSLKVTKT